MGRTRVRWVRLGVSLSLVGSLVLATGRVALGGGGGAPPGRSPAVQRYVVRPGDTLWEIARAAVGPEGDPRPFVERIRTANALAPSEPLLPGASLLVPQG
ncbi:MAG: LysM peptidoglycan-binding domain-containing protein [Actinomycetota bacterium]